MTKELPRIDPSKYTVTEKGNVIKPEKVIELPIKGKVNVTLSKKNKRGFEITKEEELEKENLILYQHDGWCDFYKKEIIIEKTLFENENFYKRGYEVLRHEIIHAFIFESGLNVNCDWAKNEELVDWIALQFPKLNKCMEKLL